MPADVEVHHFWEDRFLDPGSEILLDLYFQPFEYVVEDPLLDGKTDVLVHQWFSRSYNIFTVEAGDELSEQVALYRNNYASKSAKDHIDNDQLSIWLLELR